MTSAMLGLIAHVGKKGASDVVNNVVAELERRDLPFLMERATAALIEKSSSLDEAALAEQSDLLLVMGGDGSILRAAQRSGGHLRPIFGLNIGSLGFLTCLPASDYQRAIQCIADKNYLLSQRSLLEVQASVEQKLSPLALNDVVISRGTRSQLVRLSVSINKTPLTEYHADGLIIATPTGSTAYSLAAGGPILMPDSKAIVITPICPHVLSNRSLVVSDESEIDIEAAEDQEIFISIDGREPRLMKPRERIVLRISPRTLPLAMLPETTFAQILRQKLKWMGSNL